MMTSESSRIYKNRPESSGIPTHSYPHMRGVHIFILNMGQPLLVMGREDLWIVQRTCRDPQNPHPKREVTRVLYFWGSPSGHLTSPVAVLKSPLGPHGGCPTPESILNSILSPKCDPNAPK